MTFERLLPGFAAATLIIASTACGSKSPSPTSPSGASGTGAVTFSEPSSVSWTAPGAGSTCAAGSASDYTWTDTISETGGVQVTLTTLIVTIDGTANGPTSVNKTVPAGSQTTLPRELCFSNTSAHTITSQYSGTDANGHAIAASATSALAAKTAPSITQAQVSQLAAAITTEANPLLESTLIMVFQLTGQGTFPLDASQACQGGGTAHTFGSTTLTPGASSNSGSIAMDMSLTYSNCTVGGTVLDGGPLAIKGQLNVVQSNIDNPVKFTITGMHAFAIGGVGGTVSFNCNNSLTIDQSTFTPTALIATGDASLQFPTGQNPTTAACQVFADAFGFGSH